MQLPSPQLLADIDTSLAAISTSEPAAAGPHWGAMHKLLLKAKVDSRALLRLIGMRDLTALNATIRQLHGEVVETTPCDHPPAEVGFDPALLQTALKTFRRRIKFAQLDADSRLARSPLSGGSSPQINSMIPPREFPLAVWDALVQTGKLRREGGGFYALTDDNSQAHW